MAALTPSATGGGELAFVAVDVTDPVSVSAMVQACVRRFGVLDIAVNSAGIAHGGIPTASYPLAEWKRVLDVNLNGVFYCMQAQLQVMLGRRQGAIVNLASILGGVATAGTPAYNASKHAVVGLTRSAALDHAADGIRINCVGPGYIETPMIQRATSDPQRQARITSLHPIGRLGQAPEMAQVIAFLASDAASFVTGAYYLADGGYTAQ